MSATTFDDVQRRLERELHARHGNVRGLAREIAGVADISVETARRAVYRILNDGQTPSLDTSRMLEQGLGRRAGYFTVDRPRRDGTRPQARLQLLEEEVARLREVLRLAGIAHDDLLGRVEALEGQARRRRQGS